ncbi:Lsr2 family protein [Nonomuraea sp. SMC257]|uniref:Lsr2 family protein n=1 Tax=Nonomuraea montanisoli TaxID=2741721 RepID=A0A7Y6M3Y5_9ACTN|nr:histone-like nucleoid-structuring protein Lsr2 [Nonomuraea montanisoli]NUW34203.1 Lsr2 family protein [Nonomuraea montanisoli]
MSDADFTPLRVTHRAHGRDTDRRIRTWAKARGHPVSERGRLAPEIIDAFFAAHPEVHEQARTFEMVHATARTPGASPEDHAWQTDSLLGDIYTIVHVRGLDEHEVLRRLGAADADIRLIGDGDHSLPEGPAIITVRRIGDWTVAIEDCGWRGAQGETLSALSRGGGEAVAVHRHDYAQHHVTYAADGRLITDLNPGFPVDRQGADPDRLNRHLRDLGIDPAAGDSVDNPVPAALALAGRITGVMMSPQHLRRPVLGAAIPGALR